MASMCHDWSC